MSLTVDLIRITHQLQVAKPLGCCPSDAWSDVVAEGLDEGVEGTTVGDLGEGSNSPSSSSVILRVEAIQNLRGCFRAQGHKTAEGNTREGGVVEPDHLEKFWNRAQVVAAHECGGCLHQLSARSGGIH